MITYTVRPGVEIQIPSTGDEWQLYDGPKVDKAAERIAKSVIAAFEEYNKKCAEGCDLPAAIKAGDIILNKCLEKNSDHGASDTEPRYVRRRCWREFLTARLGVRSEIAEQIAEDLLW